MGGNAVILTLDDKRDILALAQSGGYLDGDVPIDADEINEQSQYFIIEAEKAWDTGMRDEVVGKILVSVGILDQDEFEAAMAEGEIIEEKPVVNYASSGDGPPKSSGGYSESDLREPNTAPEAETESEAWMRKNKLPIPKTPTEDADLPADLTTLDDRVLREYHSRYNGFLAKARWLHGIATGDLIRSEYIRDEALRILTLTLIRGGEVSTATRERLSCSRNASSKASEI